MVSNGKLSSVFLISLSLRLGECRAILANTQQPEYCMYDATAPVIAWPGESCHLETTSSEIALPRAEQGLSCPAIPHNTKCFPISQAGNAPSQTAFAWQDVTPYKSRPIRQALEQQSLAAGARSISLRWPDEMQHAVFFTDEACHNVGVGRSEFTWHVERYGTQIVQCESPPAGLFRSVEYMRQEEYEAFSRRIR